MTREQRQTIDARLRAEPLTGTTIAERRDSFAAYMGTMQVPGDIRVERTELAGMPANRVTREGAPTTDALVLFFHGGAWMVGSPDTDLCLYAALTSRTGVPSISPDYRLAPEHPFPAAAEDGLAAYRALLDGGIDPRRLVVAGDSAGGGLAVATLLQAKDAGLPMPAALVTFSAGLDATRNGRSMQTKDGIDPMFTPAALVGNRDLYLGGADPLQPLASPALVGDLRGLPPMLLQAGTNELLLDDTTRFAERAREAEVDVVLDITADVPHVFQTFAGQLDEADRALDRAAFFLTQQLGREG